VGALRSDGYHQVDSFFHLISLHDVLTVHPASSFNFESSADLGISNEDNFVVRTVKAMTELHGKELPAIRLGLEKNIPHGAGLGGGSSNAAAAIFILSQLWNLPFDDPRHLQLAAQIGSDVPLFLAPTTASIMTGRGEILKESKDPILDLPLAIVKPAAAHSPTGAVYQAFDANPQPMHELSVWKNNLEKAAIEVSPKTAELLNWLRSQDEVELAQVAGSGCACWAQFDKRASYCKDTNRNEDQTVDLQLDLVRKAKNLGHWACLAHTVNSGIHEASVHG